MRKFVVMVPVVALLAAGSTACATKKFVRGEVGQVNEKVEGFFDICRTRGLTGDQGVIIPGANADHLMLREDVVEEVSKGKFGIYAVETVDQGIELLTGRPAGERGPDGRFPDGSINQLVEARLAGMAEIVRKFGIRDDSERSHD